MILAEKLIQCGYEVLYHVANRKNWPRNIPVLESLDDNLRRNAIAVYPEIIAGNPLRVQNVARLVLFYPGRNGGTHHYHKSEMIFSYLPEFLPGADVLTIPWINTNLFYNPRHPKTQDYCFVYKGGRWRKIPELEGLPAITMKWPSTREELADILRHTRTLYSFDNKSAVLEEALQCGAKVMLVTPTGYEEYKSYYSNVTANFPKQFHNFVQRTQSSNYTDRIQSKYLFLYWAYAVWRYWIKPHFVHTKTE